jgi:replication factor A2
MSASQQGSQSGERKVCTYSDPTSPIPKLPSLTHTQPQSYADDTLRPVTIKQLVDCKEAYQGAEAAIDGIPTTQVTLVGQVRTVTPGTINLTYRIDDGTGVIDVKKWIDAEKGETTPRLAPDTYVRVFGRLQSYQGKRHVSAHYIRAIEDFNEVNYHMLEATYVHLTLTKGAAAAGGGGGQQQQQGGGGDSGGGDEMFVDGGYGAGGGGGGASTNVQLATCTRNARTMFNFLTNSPGDGGNLNQVAAGTGLSARDIMAGAEELLGVGAIYTTEDDETWAVMEC